LSRELSQNIRLPLPPLVLLLPFSLPQGCFFGTGFTIFFQYGSCSWLFFKVPAGQKNKQIQKGATISYQSYNNDARAADKPRRVRSTAARRFKPPPRVRLGKHRDLCRPMMNESEKQNRLQKESREHECLSEIPNKCYEAVFCSRGIISDVFRLNVVARWEPNGKNITEIYSLRTT